MSLKSSTANYKKAKELYNLITSNFDKIESDNDPDIAFHVDETLEHIKKLKSTIARIDIVDFNDKYDKSTIDILNGNISTFKEAAYFIGNKLDSMKSYDAIQTMLPKYISDVNWKLVGSNIEEVSNKLGAYLMADKNKDNFKSIVNNITTGKLSKNAFKKMFDIVSPEIKSRINKKQINPSRHPLPPEMWPEKDKEKWEELNKPTFIKNPKPTDSISTHPPKELEVRGSTYIVTHTGDVLPYNFVAKAPGGKIGYFNNDNEGPIYVYQANENFISLEEYKNLLENNNYYDI